MSLKRITLRVHFLKIFIFTALLRRPNQVMGLDAAGMPVGEKFPPSLSLLPAGPSAVLRLNLVNLRQFFQIRGAHLKFSLKSVVDEHGKNASGTFLCRFTAFYHSDPQRATPSLKELHAVGRLITILPVSGTRVPPHIR